MSKEENQACETPLAELLRSTPISYRASWESHWNEAGDAIGHTMSPLGRYAHEAADMISRLNLRIEELEETITDMVLSRRCDEMEDLKDSPHSNYKEQI